MKRLVAQLEEQQAEVRRLDEAITRNLRELDMKCSDIRFSRHAFERMFERAIAPAAVLRIIAEGEIIASYPDDSPWPSVLILGFEGGRPLHVVVAQEPQSGLCSVVTVYSPDPKLWSDDFRTRRGT